MDGTLLHIRGGGPFGYDQFCKRGATSRDTDVLLERFDIHREVERQRENRRGEITAGTGIVRGAFREAQLEFVELDRLDDVKLPSIRKNSLDNEAFDAVVQPCNLRMVCIISIRVGNLGVVHTRLGVQHCLRGLRQCCLVLV